MNRQQEQGSIVNDLLDDHLESWIEAFMYDRTAQNMSPGTLQFYQVKMRVFVSFCQTQAITRIGQLSAGDLRRFIVWLQETGHNAGGRHACYRAVKTFLRWYEDEAEPENWRNPIQKVKAPKVPVEPLEPVGQGDIQALLSTCDKSFTGRRDRAIMLVLLDTGLRAQELLDIDLDDLDLITGSILIKSGKGRKPRTVFIGSHCKKAIRAYLKGLSGETGAALWMTDDLTGRLKYWGLRSMVARRAQAAGVPAPGIHAFRRQFAISMLRAGTDLITLSRLMGHTSIVVLQRYLKQLTDDLQDAHRKAGPVDRGGY